ncbi:MAG: hypothetical protein KUG68_00810 [Flavobacteriaceae bacterium]|nr:hypothetical protein [Flavobacteriaceae bacterium]
MKTLRKTIYLSIVCLAMVFASCSSDDDNNDDDGGGGGASAGTLTASVDGAAFESDPAFTQIQVLNGGTVVAITGPKAQETIQFNVNAYTGVGAYSVSPSTIASYGIVTDPSDPIGSVITYVAITTGELNVTEDTGSNMKGTFSFVGVNPLDPSDSVNVTNGAFNISY